MFLDILGPRVSSFCLLKDYNTAWTGFLTKYSECDLRQVCSSGLILSFIEGTSSYWRPKTAWGSPQIQPKAGHKYSLRQSTNTAWGSSQIPEKDWSEDQWFLKGRDDAWRIGNWCARMPQLHCTTQMGAVLSFKLVTIQREYRELIILFNVFNCSSNF